MRVQKDLDFVRPLWAHELGPELTEAWFQPDDIDSRTGFGAMFDYPEVAASFNQLDLVRAARLHADADFLHTVPFTLGKRSFVFFCRSVPDIFTPFVRRGSGPSCTKLRRILPIYKNLFKSDACLSVLFYQKADLEDFRRLFPSQIIAKKLRLTSLIAEPGTITSAVNRRPQLTLLFSGGPAGGTADFLLRGGLLAVKALDVIRREVDDARLIIAARGAKDAALQSSSSDPIAHPFADPAIAGLLRKHADRIVWIEDKLTDHSMERLRRSADFLIQPSIDGDPSSITQAIAKGCIPIVSNFHGAAEWVRHGQTGIVLDLLDDRFSGPSALGFNNSNHQRFIAEQHDLLGRMDSLLAPWIGALASPTERTRFREEMAARADRRFHNLNVYRHLSLILQKPHSPHKGELRILKPLNFDIDFEHHGGEEIFSFGDRRIMAQGPEFLTAPNDVSDPFVLWTPRLPSDPRPQRIRRFQTETRAIADLISLDAKTTGEIFRSAPIYDPRPSLAPSGPVEPLQTRSDLRVRRLSLAAMNWSAPTAGKAELQNNVLRIAFSPGEWAYSAWAPLDEVALAGADWIVVQMGATSDAFGIGLLNKKANAFVARIDAPEDRDALEVWLPIVDPTDISSLAVQNWQRPPEAILDIQHIFTVGKDSAIRLAVTPSGTTPRLEDQQDLDVIELDLRDAALDIRFASQPLPPGRRKSNTLWAIAPPEPWCYAVQIGFDRLLTARDTAIVVHLRSVGAPIGVGLVNPARNAFLTRLKTPDDAQDVEVWLPINAKQEVGALVLHNWNVPMVEPVEIARITIVRRRPAMRGIAESFRRMLRRLSNHENDPP